MDAFYCTLQETINGIPKKDTIIMMGDFIAKVGSQRDMNGTTGMFGLGDRNERGERLVDFCSLIDIVITNTQFKQSKPSRAEAGRGGLLVAAT